MNDRRLIPDEVRRVQIEASDPAVSAWVSANAGSGKTYVLAQRVIRLMLAGSPPAKILCLTFTKAAAANMANQVFGTLAQWIALADAELDRAIAQIEGGRPDAARRVRARRLFAEALDTPGGLKVQTIHAFCTRLLHQFPFEANVAARFSVLEERAERELLERLRIGVLLEAAGAPNTAYGRALATAIAATTDRAFAAATQEAIAKRDQLIAWLADRGGIDGAVDELCGLLGVAAGDRVDDVERNILESPILPRPEWLETAAILAGGSNLDRDRADGLRRAAELSGMAALSDYLRVFLTDANEPRVRIVTNAIAGKSPALADRLGRERDRVAELMRRRFAIEARDRTAALLRIAAAVIERYRAEKDRRGLLDYDDLIDKTLALMSKVDAAWVHYKLDLGVDHVLIDEAQDTSPKQWDIVRRLAAEFTAGEGARGAASRSIFAVGDEKQSIFSFQGAAPHEFAANRDHFDRQHRNADLEFRRREFKHSFRSGANVLGAVDRVFGDPPIYASVTTDAAGIPPHIALPDTLPGRVEIWPAIAAEKQADIEAWDAPFDDVSEKNPQVKLAGQIAETVRVAILAGRRPGEILILVRQRGPLFEAILRALKNREIAVAGADRLVLTEHIAVMDLLVLADALLLESDDLALATLLKSPLFGLDDEDLFRLAWRRTGTIHDTLVREMDDPRLVFAAEKITRLGALARRMTPFEFYACLLGQEGGRKQFLARLGTEAADALDEFLNLALAYESQETPTLQGFVAWMRTGATEVKRDMDIARDEVRVMTVHGAKGLEAPLVILADTTTRPAGPRDPKLLPVEVLRAPAGTLPRFVWAGPVNSDVGVMIEARAAARRAAEDEYRRLLYVAMTRAAEHLIVCAAQGVNGRPPGCWYDLICRALVPSDAKQPEYGQPDPDGGDARPMLEAHHSTQGRVNEPASGGSRHENDAERPPDWITRDASPPTPSARTVRPSSTLIDERPDRALRGERARAMVRGLLSHRLLQGLPEIPREARRAAAERYLDRQAMDWSAAERENLIRQVLAVLEHRDFADLFGPQTAAEVPIVGRIPCPGHPPVMVSGQVDRLCVGARQILIADYKTNRPVPQALGEIPPAYVHQLALYRAVIALIYPGREVKAALVWTDTPEIMELPGWMLDGTLATLIRD